MGQGKPKMMVRRTGGNVLQQEYINNGAVVGTVAGLGFSSVITDIIFSSFSNILGI